MGGYTVAYVTTLGHDRVAVLQAWRVPEYRKLPRVAPPLRPGRHITDSSAPASPHATPPSASAFTSTSGEPHPPAMADSGARPPLGHRGSSSVSLHNKDAAASGDYAHGDHPPRHTPHKKQFVVGGSTRLHSRIPSHGRGLNKLGLGLAKIPAATTSPKDRPRSARKATFELASDGSDGSQPNSFRDSNANGGVNTAHHHAAAPTRTAVSDLIKSSSTRSLDRESRAAASRATSGAKAKGARSKSGDRTRRDHLSKPRRHHSTDALTDMAPKPIPQPQPQPPPSPSPDHGQALPQFRLAARRPLSPRASNDNISAVGILDPTPPPQQQTPSTAINTPSILHQTPITPAHSLPSSQEQFLTSRFLASPRITSSTGTETPIRRSESDATLTQPTTHLLRIDSTPNLPSRTQQKLWLQRASSQYDIPAESRPEHIGPGSEWFAFQGRAGKEYERVAKEYMNVRRFKDPVAEGVDRIRLGDIKKIPSNRKGGDSGMAMGLSQSLKDQKRKVEFTRIAGVAKDDIASFATPRNRMAVAHHDEAGIEHEIDVQAIITKMWRGEMLVSNE